MVLPVKDPVVESLNAMIDARIEQKLAALTGNLTGETLYKSQPPSARPPRCNSTKAMTARLHRYTIAHWTEGDATQKVYICRAADWHAALHRPAKVKPPVLHLVPTADEDLAEQAMRDAGLRSTRGAR